MIVMPLNLMNNSFLKESRLKRKKFLRRIDRIITISVKIPLTTKLMALEIGKIVS